MTCFGVVLNFPIMFMLFIQRIPLRNNIEVNISIYAMSEILTSGFYN